MDHATLIDRMGGTKEVAADLRAPFIRVYHWKERGRIPPRHWHAVVELAARKGIPGITLETLHQQYAEAV